MTYSCITASLRSNEAMFYMELIVGELYVGPTFLLDRILRSDEDY